MARSRWISVVGSVALASSLLVGVGAAPAAAKVKHYANCTALNRVYPHGVGRPSAKDKVSGRYQPGKSVTNFTKNRAVYNANSDMDRDGDGIACEKR